ncbi:STAS domain-containing protein [Streptosporangium sp. NPDC000396]|uniref:STAS domain-containing protein n=1 Tax=Streptosporangium sp. NPDC000396 TaxID=3366185 RepID=UPI0036B93EB3
MSAAVTVTLASEDALENTSPRQVRLLALAGELDYTNAERFQHDLRNAIGSEECDLIVDLTELSFCDSTGIRVFVAVRKLVNDRGGNIVLTNPHPRLERIFHLTGLAQAFAVQPTIADAVEILRARQSS